MAKLTRLPEQEIIDGLKGKVDFYLWMGIPVARSWPRSPGQDRALSVQSTWPAFTYAAQNWNTLSKEIRGAYISMSLNTGLTGRDMFMRSYLSGLYQYPTP